METKNRYIKTRNIHTASELEKKIEAKFRDKIKSLGGRALKFISPGNAGVPDRLVILPNNRIGFAELKRPGGKTTKLQDRQIAFIKKLGCFVMVVDSEEKIDKFIERLQNNETNI